MIQVYYGHHSCVSKNSHNINEKEKDIVMFDIWNARKTAYDEESRAYKSDVPTKSRVEEVHRKGSQAVRSY